MPRTDEQHYVTLGPPRSGKTALSASLQLAARCGTYDGDVDVVSQDGATLDLFRAFAGVITSRSGTLPFEASVGVTTYTAELVLRSRRLFGRKETRQRFTFIDAPGGVLGGADGEDVDHGMLAEYRARVVAALADADGFILCVDATDPEAAAVFVRELPHLLASVRRAGRPFRRIAVCLTKADAYFHELGTKALTRSWSADPMAHAKTLLTPVGHAALREAGDRDTVYGYTWTSVFGFDQKTGEANYDATTGGLAVTREMRSMPVAAAAWRPYNVLAPFMFVATGGADNVVVERGRR